MAPGRVSLTLWLGMALMAAGVYEVAGLWREGSGGSDQSCNGKLEQMLKVLTNEMVELKKEVIGLRKEILGKNKGSDGELNILSVSRKSEGDEKNRYTIRYQFPPGNRNVTSPLRVLWREFSDQRYILLPETISNEIPNLSHGVFETSTTTAKANDSHLVVFIGESDAHLLVLYLDNEDGRELTEVDVEVPLLEIAPKGDIIYTPGQNATFDIQHPPENTENGPGGIIPDYNFNAGYVLTEPGIDTVFNRYTSNSSEIIHLKEKAEYVEKIESRFEVETDTLSYSGLINVESGITKNNGLVRRVEQHKQIVLRPSNQHGPFPSGKIYRHYGGFEERNENGDIIGFCSYGKTCSVYSLFFGNNLSSMTLYKTVNQKTTQEDLKILGGKTMSYLKAGEFDFTPSASDPSPVRYTFKVKNLKGNVLTGSTIVHFGTEVEILANETSMELLRNGTANIVCTARGLPLPKVTINCDGVTVTPEVVYQSDDIIRVKGICQNVYWKECVAKNEFREERHNFW